MLIVEARGIAVDGSMCRDAHYVLQVNQRGFTSV